MNDKVAKLSETGIQIAQEFLAEKLKEANAAGAPITAFIEVTPELAKVILDNNPDNRNLRLPLVSKLRQDMEEGRFLTNGETIIISNRGELNDGQHRLTAILQSGLKQLVNLVVGTTRESRFTVDTGVVRSAGMMLQLQGRPYGNTEAAAARRIISFQRTGGLAAIQNISTPEITNMVHVDGLLQEVSSWAHIHQTKMRPFGLPASEVAAMFYLLGAKYPKEAKCFMEAMRDGVGLSSTSPILSLRNKLMVTKKLSLNQRAELVVRSWNYWIRDEQGPSASMQVLGKIPEIRGPKRNVATATK